MFLYKICTKCKESLNLENFHKDKCGKLGRRSECKKCVSKAKKLYQQKEGKKLYAKRKERFFRNPDKKEKAYIKVKEWASKNSKKISQNKKRYYKENKNKIIQQKLERQKYREKNDTLFLLTRRLRARLRSALKNQYKSGSAVRDLGCSISYLKKHLESQFQPGMSWDNYREWHIDHIHPLASFNLTDRNELLKACNYTNLQPLWAKDNLKKGANYAEK